MSVQPQYSPWSSGAEMETELDARQRERWEQEAVTVSQLHEIAHAMTETMEAKFKELGISVGCLNRLQVAQRYLAVVEIGEVALTWERMDSHKQARTDMRQMFDQLVDLTLEMMKVHRKQTREILATNDSKYAVLLDKSE